MVRAADVRAVGCTGRQKAKGGTDSLGR